MSEKHRFEHNNHTNLAFLLVSVTLQALLLWLSYIIYETWIAAFGLGWRDLEIAFCAFAFTFISATLLAVRYSSRLVRWYYWFAAYWFACIGPLFGASVLFVLLEYFGPHVGVGISSFWAGVISFSIAVAFIIYGIWQSQRMEIVRISVDLPGLPPEWKGKTIALVSDVHLGDVRNAHFAHRVVKKINSFKPEMILIAGDLYDGLCCDPVTLVAPFGDFVSSKGTYFVSGNHDYLGRANDFFAAIRGVGIRILENEIVDLGGLQLAGVDFEDTSHRKDFENVLRDMSLDVAHPSILVKHVPDNLDLAGKKGFSLQLSGHTHHGQFWPLSLITHYLFKGYDYGLNKMDRMWIYTSSGVGAWGPPFRLGTKSEIVAITLA
jgi:hypothetical protein